MPETKVIKPFTEPGFTMFNNCILDHIMPKLRPNAWKVLCVAIRQTWGWEDKTTESGRKEEDEISYSQFLDRTGIRSKSTLSSAIQECLEKRYLMRREIGRHPGTNKPIFAYSLNRDYELEIASTENGLEASTESVPEENPSSTEDVLESDEASTESVQTKQTSSLKKSSSKEKKQSKFFDFPENPAPSPGGGDLATADEAAIIAEIADDFLNRPSPEDLQRIAEAKQADTGGNWADPDAFSLADHLITAACARLGRSEPQGKKRDNAVAFFKKALKDEGLLQGNQDMLEQAVKDWLNPEGDYAFYLPQYELTTRHELALRHFGIVLSKAKAQPAKPARYARTAELAAESQAALAERKAARDPPVEDDKIGGAVKAALRDQMSALEYDTYVNLTRFACDDGKLVVIAPTAFNKDWLENRLELTIKRALHGFADGPQEIRFETREGS